MLLIIILILIELILIYFFISSLWSYYCTKVPFVSCSQKNIRKIFELVSLESDKTLYDLGCGDGRVLVTAYKKFGIKGVGFELDPWAYVKGKIKTWPYGQDIKIYRADFLKADLGQPDYIFLYLLPAMMENLERKLLLELKNPCQIFSFCFQFPNLKPTRVLETKPGQTQGRIYVYQLFLGVGLSTSLKAGTSGERPQR